MENWHIFDKDVKLGEKLQTAIRVPVAGQPNRGELMPGTRSGGDYEMPVFLINGAQPGRTLLVTAGMHAGEYNGTPAVIQVARSLDPAAMSGRLIAIPCVNTSGFWTLHPRVTPEDHFNFNAQYPGRGDGTVGERVADFFVREIFPHIDFMLDFHGGSRGERMTPLAFFPTHSGVRAASLAAAKALNIGFMIESRATRGQYSYAASQMNIPGLLVERGEGYFCDGDWVEADRVDLLLLLAHLGILPEIPGLRDDALPRRVFREAVYLDSEWDGLWIPEVKKDRPISKGQRLGTLTDFFGNSVAEVRAVADGHVLYVNTGLAVPKGDFLVAYALAASETTP